MLTLLRRSEFVSNIEKLVRLVDSFIFNLRVRLLDVSEDIHALLQFFLHSVALLLVNLRLLLQLLQSRLKVILLRLESCLALLAQFSLARQLFD